MMELRKRRRLNDPVFPLFPKFPLDIQFHILSFAVKNGLGEDRINQVCKEWREMRIRIVNEFVNHRLRNLPSNFHLRLLWHVGDYAPKSYMRSTTIVIYKENDEEHQGGASKVSDGLAEKFESDEITLNVWDELAILWRQYQTKSSRFNYRIPLEFLFQQLRENSDFSLQLIRHGIGQATSDIFYFGDFIRLLATSRRKKKTFHGCLHAHLTELIPSNNTEIVEMLQENSSVRRAFVYVCLSMPWIL